MSFYTRKINQKNTELRVASEAKSEFLSRMSHDIRTPMNGIIGMLNMAEKSADNPEEVRSCLGKMRIASDYLLSLINDVLDMSRMEAHQVNQTSQYVTCCFVVADNGIGMSPDFQQHMFEPFAQENSGARSNFKGTDLGLSIVKKIVDYKKGDIQVSSIPRKGTTISVTPTFRIDEKYKDVPVKPAIAPVNLSGMHILAAEDNDMSAEILQLLLEDAGSSYRSLRLPPMSFRKICTKPLPPV